ncbi:MAG: hypothetical protein JWM11_3453 [Planctomycetaceae bacterium]|nr:hypothetical protein [Planctomycetaceae bacterium]
MVHSAARVKEEVTPNFGLIIAYLIPGATALYGISYFVPTVHGWFGASPENAPSLGGFLYLTIAAFAAGMTISTVRWGLLDTLHHVTGIKPPTLDFAELSGSVDAFDYLVEIHYRYYMFYGNGVTALAFTYVLRHVALATKGYPWGWGDIAFVLLEVIFFLGSRDTLSKYYRRTERLLSPKQNRPHKESVDGP